MRAYTLCLLVPLLLVLGLNSSVDAAGLGEAAMISRLAREQDADELIVAPVAIDRRAWVRARLAGGERCPDVLVLGSSTVGQLADGMFGSLSVLNAYLGGPTVEDFEALTMILRRTACRPRMLLVGVDPWWLGNAQVDDRRWMTLADDYLEYLGNSPLSRIAIHARIGWSRLEERVNFTTTRESLRLLAGKLRGDTVLGAHRACTSAEELCSNARAPLSLTASDGHYVTCSALLPNASERARIAEGYLPSNMHSMREWREVATERIERFGRLVNEWAQSYGQIVLVAPPYNPDTYPRLRADPLVRRNLDELDARLEQLQGDTVTFVQLRDPTTVSCARDEFEDSHHAAPACVRKIAQAVAERSSASTRVRAGK